MVTVTRLGRLAVPLMSAPDGTTAAGGTLITLDARRPRGTS